MPSHDSEPRLVFSRYTSRHIDPLRVPVGFDAAVAALNALSMDDATRAYATSVGERRRASLLAEGYREKRSPICVAHLHGKRCPHDSYHRDTMRHTWPGDAPERDHHWCLPSGVDHTHAYTKDGKTAFIVSEPYDLQWEELRDLIPWCEANGAEATIEGWGHYFPGRTLSLILRAADEPGRIYLSAAER